MSTLTAFPPEVHTLAGKCQDNLHEFGKRDPLSPRFETRHAGQMAVKLLGDLIDRLVEFRGDVGHEVEDYERLFRPGGLG